MIVVNANEPAKYKKVAKEVWEHDRIKVDALVIGGVKKYAIERKEIMSDLRHSLYDGRLWRQCGYLEQLREQGYKPIIVMEGELWKAFRFGKMKVAEWIGIQVGIAGWGIPRIDVRSANDYLTLLRTLDEKAGEVTKYTEPVIKEKDRTVKEEREDMLRMISGIGEVTAKVLIERAGGNGTIKDVCMMFDDVAREDELKDLLKRRYDRVKEVLVG